MYRKNRLSISYIFFWICLLLMIGFLIIFVLNYDDIMEWSYYSKEKSKLEESPMNSSEMPEDMEKDSRTEISETNMAKMELTRQEALFTRGTLTPTGAFVNESGTVFSVGKIFFTGKFPDDFNISNNLPSTNVSITFSFGWRNLPRFDELKNLGRESNIELELEPLDVIETEITIIDSMKNTQTTENIKSAINEYIYSIFKNQVIPSNMIHVAQQRLSSAYILNNYNNVEFTTTNN